MHLFEPFFPDEIHDSTYEIPFGKWYETGYRGVIFDIDNTLVPHGADANEKSIALFTKLRRIGFKTMLLSNNKEPRVKRFNQQIGSGYIYKAGKPSKRNYLKAMQEMGTDRENTLFVGDQLFTDVWGAKKAGILSILVKPINPREEIQIVLKRYLERVVLHFYRKREEQAETFGKEKK